MAAENNREKALDAALANIEKQFGKGSVMRLGDETRAPLEVIPTGAISLDIALGLGGLPRGRVVEIYGPESSGKTTVALHAVASAQAAGGTVAFIDAEHALDPEYAKALGWTIIASESHDRATGRTHDTRYGSDVVCIDTDGRAVFIQAAGRYEKAPHYARFKARAGGKCPGRFLYWEFVRGNKTPVLEEVWKP